MKNKYQNTERDFKTALAMAGVDLPAVIGQLTSHLKESKQDFQIIGGMMDQETKLTEKVKLLELELFIEVLKKQ